MLFVDGITCTLIHSQIVIESFCVCVHVCVCVAVVSVLSWRSNVSVSVYVYVYVSCKGAGGRLFGLSVTSSWPVAVAVHLYAPPGVICNLSQLSPNLEMRQPANSLPSPLSLSPSLSFFLSLPLPPSLHSPALRLNFASALCLHWPTWNEHSSTFRLPSGRLQWNSKHCRRGSEAHKGPYMLLRFHENGHVGT